MITLERIMDFAKAKPLVRAITQMMQGALGVALFATPGYAVAAESKVAKGGHFAAWEQPRLFAEEVRASFRSLR